MRLFDELIHVTSDEQTDTEKKAYAAPRLVVYGTVEELTEQSTNDGNDNLRTLS